MRNDATSWISRWAKASRLALVATLLACLTTGMAAAASHPAKPVYGAPFYANQWTALQPCHDNTTRFKPNGPTEATVDAAISDYKLAILSCISQGCSFSVSATDASHPYAWVAAGVTLGNGCFGDVEDIAGTRWPTDDGAGDAHGSGEGDADGDSAPNVGDPMNAASGNKFLKEDDYTDTPWLQFRRMYNSDPNIGTKSSVGTQWSHTYDRSLSILGSPAATIVVKRPDGSGETFNKSGTAWVSTNSQTNTLVESDSAQGVPTGFALFIGASRRTEKYGPTGQLLSISDATGQGVTLAYSTTTTPAAVAPTPGLLLTVTDSEHRQLNFSYSSDGTLAQLTLPDQQTIKYTNGGRSDYNALYTVQYPDATVRTYLYNESGFFQSASSPLLTGITDEAGHRYSSIGYDSSYRAILTYFGNGASSTGITYNADGTSSITYPLGHSSAMSFSSYGQSSLIGSVDQSCGADCPQRWQSRTYDTNGYPASTTDFKGTVTLTTYDAVGDLTGEVDANGTSSQRTINTTWNTTLRVPTSRTILDQDGHPVAKAAWVYNTMAEPVVRCEIDPAVAPSYVCAATGTAPAGVRRWVYSYCTAVGTGCPIVGLLLKETGPRTDVVQTTTYAYYTTSSAVSCGTPGGACYQAGDLHIVTDALGRVTTFASYDGAGRVTRVTDANGINTDSTYTPRGQLATHSVGGATTTLTYAPFGAIASIRDADGVTTHYYYDEAHRLAYIYDGADNYIVYTLDSAGNKIAEQVYTADDTLVRSTSRTFSALGQLTTLVDGLNNTVFRADMTSSYDANGDLVLSSDANGIQRQQGLDPLRRLVSTIQNYGGSDTATKNTATTVAYDPLNRVTGTSDPGSLNTVYTFDGLGDRTSIQSPDTGTSSDTFDAAGDRLTHKDAKGVVATSTYDALNRKLTQAYVDSTLNAFYKYDEANSVTGCTASSPVGRLTRIVENTVTTTFCYDGRGNVIQKKQLQGTATDVTAYTYTAANRLLREVTPDSTAVTYTHDTLGNIATIQVAPSVGASVTAVSAATYLPFGPVISYMLGNGQIVTRTYDANYAVTDVVSPALTLHFARNAMGNVSAIGNAAGASPATETFGYDPLYRLISVTDGTTIAEAFTYNQTGDRLSKTGTGLATGTYVYTSGTHQLTTTGTAARANDANGSTTSTTVAGQVFGYGYNGRGRLTVVQASGQTVATYTYNALGQRVQKAATLPQAITQRYTYDESNRLMGEYTSTAKRDTVWMNDVPVAVVDVNGTTSAISYIHADGLGTPRAVTNSAGATIWTWSYMGNPFGESLPVATGGFTLNLRFAGQYFDAESGALYNLNRTYEPSTGRFLQSDPLGLLAGSSTYSYVLGNPLNLVDALGLDPHSRGPHDPSREAIGGAAGTAVGTVLALAFSDTPLVAGEIVVATGLLGVYVYENGDNPGSVISSQLQNSGPGSATSLHAVENP